MKLRTRTASTCVQKSPRSTHEETSIYKTSKLSKKPYAVRALKCYRINDREIKIIARSYSLYLLLFCTTHLVLRMSSVSLVVVVDVLGWDL
jgi:hypothetical protein